MIDGSLIRYLDVPLRRHAILPFPLSFSLFLSRTLDLRSFKK